MKPFLYFRLIFIIVLTACAPQATATSSPTIAFTNPPLATASSEPTQTPKPTAAPITVTETLLDSCREIVEAKISSAGILEVLFESEAGSSSNSIVSEFGYSHVGQPAGSTIWSEDSQRAIRFPIPPDAFEAKISSDHRWLLFRRDTTETQSEFWVVGMDGKAGGKLATVRLDEKIKAKYPDRLFSLDYGWIPNTDKFFYKVDVAYAEEFSPLTIDKFVMVDINSGKAIPVTIPSDTQTFDFAPDGSQMALLMESELRVLSTQDGRTLFTIQAPLNEPTYSPDGTYLVDFIEGGVLRINARDGQQQIIPLKYTIMSTRTEGPSYGPLPDFLWIDTSTLLLTSLNSDERYVFPVFKHEPGWTFTVWQIDLTTGTTHSIQTFNGDPSSARISPDQKRLAFLKHEGMADSKTRNLFLADLATGETLEVIEGGVFEAWFPDSNKYLYATGVPYPPPGKGDPGAGEVEIKYYLGQIGEEPTFVNWKASDLEWTSWWWVDENRLVMNCKIITFP
jgi:Tol biopolymer transport system component